MKKIKYDLFSIVDEKPLFYASKSMPWSEANEEIAKKESYNGEYEIYDDGEEDPIPAPYGNLEERMANVESDVASLTAAIEKGLSL